MIIIRIKGDIYMEDLYDRKFSFRYDLQLFAKDGEGGEKTEEPTSKKLSDARNKGQVAKSMEVTTAVSLLTFFLSIKFFIGYIGNRILEVYKYIYSSLSDYSAEQFTLPRACALIGYLIQCIITIAIPFMLVSFAAAFISQQSPPNIATVITLAETPFTSGLRKAGLTGEWSSNHWALAEMTSVRWQASTSLKFTIDSHEALRPSASP